MASSQSNFSQLRDFLSYLATVRGDLSNITAPPFVLSSKSVTEIPASWAERHKLFLQPALEDDPAQRCLLVLKNFLCSLKRQLYTAATDSSDGGAKKPLNAFLGELFLGTFESGASSGESSSTTFLICEQVSHHPPVTACFLYNRAYGMSSSGYVAQETSFSLTSGVRVKQIGHAIIRDEKHGESHLMTLPTMTVKGLLVARPYPELEGTCYIVSSSGYLATISFLGKNIIGLGDKNGVHAEVTRVRKGDENEGRAVFEVSGKWNGTLKIRDSLNGGKVIDEFDVDDLPLSELRVVPLEEQSPWESRRAWGNVIEAIKAGDVNAVNHHKTEIEQAQRAFRAAEQEAGCEWPRVFFAKGDNDQEFEVLSRAIPDRMARGLQIDRTAGVWKFVGIPTAEELIARSAYHEGLEPTGQIERNAREATMNP